MSEIAAAIDAVTAAAQKAVEALEVYGEAMRRLADAAEFSTATTEEDHAALLFAPQHVENVVAYAEVAREQAGLVRIYATLRKPAGVAA